LKKRAADDHVRFSDIVERALIAYLGFEKKTKK
jgi:hypothetical protein